MKKTLFPRNSKGFTLIELIVVIAILATVAGIAYPALMSVGDVAKATNAHNACIQIVNGVDQFSKDNNGMLPYDPEEMQADDEGQLFLNTKAGEDARLVQILTNREEDEDKRINKDSTIYANAEEQETPMDGLFIDADGGVSYYDPWGHPYQVVLCEEPQGCYDPFKPLTKKNRTRKPCLVYSLGPDGQGMGVTSSEKKKSGKNKPAASDDDDEDTTKDNVYSWKKVK